MLTEEEIERLMALTPKYLFEFYGCPDVRISVLELPAKYTLSDALNELGWVFDVQAEITERRKA